MAIHFNTEKELTISNTRRRKNIHGRILNEKQKVRNRENKVFVEENISEVFFATQIERHREINRDVRELETEIGREAEITKKMQRDQLL